MPIVLLLLAILIVLVGGPVALLGVATGAVALPAYLLWASGIIGFLFWGVVIAIGLLISGAVVILISSFFRIKNPSSPVILSEQANSPFFKPGPVCMFCNTAHAAGVANCTAVQGVELPRVADITKARSAS